jgi:hypothetical protein
MNYIHFKKLIKYSLLLKRLAGEICIIGDGYKEPENDILHEQANKLNDISHACFKVAYKVKEKKED